jgi:hypothetical protein
MACHICGLEAVGRCYSCGELFCAAHGDENCMRCTSAIHAGDPRQDRISAVKLRAGAKPGWWRPLPAEEYKPPACYQCQGLARRVCPNCQHYYCAEHAGGNVCAACSRSGRIGLYILAALAGLLLTTLLYRVIWPGV